MRSLTTAACYWCGREYRPHPGFADHQDTCRLNPINLDHIRGHANAIYGGDRS